MKKSKKTVQKADVQAKKRIKESEETDKKVDFWGGYRTTEGKKGDKTPKKPKENQKKKTKRRKIERKEWQIP